MRICPAAGSGTSLSTNRRSEDRGAPTGRLAIVHNRFMAPRLAESGRLLEVGAGFVEQVEVLHGPASALYGSSAIGGVVAMQTVEPALHTGNRGHMFRRLFLLCSKAASGTGHPSRHRAATLCRNAY